MDNNEFDLLIKSKIKEEKPLIEGNNIDEMIDKSIRRVKAERRFKFILNKPIIAASLFFIVASITITAINENKMMIGNSEIVQEKGTEKSLAIVDITKEKEKLQQEGYIVSNKGINIGQDISSVATAGNAANSSYPVDKSIISNSPVDYDMSSYTSSKKAYNMTLKNQVFSADYVLKGQVLGVNYFIDNIQTFTKAKILIEESYDNNLKSGDIITVYKFGGVITQYEFMILNGIDKKFNMSNDELEEAKKKMVVSDNYDGKLLYPDDNVILLLNKTQDRPSTMKEGEYFASRTVVEYKDDEIIKPPYIKGESVYLNEIEDADKEVYSYDKVSELEEKLKSDIEEKKNFSKDKAIQAAYNSLSEDDKKRFSNIYKSDVTYYSNEKIVSGNKVIETQIDVRIPTNDEKTSIFVSMNNNYKIINIVK